MMRQLKFRAWTGDRMILPDLADWDDFFILPDGDIGFMDEDSRSYSGHRFLSYRKEWEVMQFVGIIDIIGQNVFEGDIVNQLGGNKKVVVWDEANLCFILVWLQFFQKESSYRNGNIVGGKGYTFDKITDSKKVEVIGNIHQNPELLNS